MRNDEMELGQLACSSVPGTGPNFKTGSPTSQESPRSQSNGTVGYFRSKSHHLDPVRSQEGAWALESGPSSNPHWGLPAVLPWGRFHVLKPWHYRNGVTMPTLRLLRGLGKMRYFSCRTKWLPPAHPHTPSEVIKPLTPVKMKIG